MSHTHDTNVGKRRLELALAVTLSVMFIEFAGGWLSNSLALTSDAWHMFTHSTALLLGIVAIILAKRPPCHHQTYGLYRTEILVAALNGIFLLVVGVLIIYDSIQRFLNPSPILGTEMLVVAFIGLAANLISMLLLRGVRNNDLNTKSVFYHVIADALSSVGVIAAGFAIMFTGFYQIDPIVSLGISAAILYWAWGVLRDSARVLLETAPAGINAELISKDVALSFPEIERLFDVHVWSITSKIAVLSARLKLKKMPKSAAEQNKLVSKINSHLAEKYGIVESTIQVVSELPSECDSHSDDSCKVYRCVNGETNPHKKLTINTNLI
jgi:cobalt-zinc-cadmium efflux system protein